jgi:hypothetical protein
MSQTGLVDDIRRRIDFEDNGRGCWHWLGVVGSVPEMRVGGKRVSVRRLVWEWYHGVTLGPHVRVQRVCHCADCVNPRHMERQGFLANRQRERLLAERGRQHGRGDATDARACGT